MPKDPRIEEVESVGFRTRLWPVHRIDRHFDTGTITSPRCQRLVRRPELARRPSAAPRLCYVLLFFG